MRRRNQPVRRNRKQGRLGIPDGGQSQIPSVPGGSPGSPPGGDVFGPASAVDGNLAVFDGTTGKQIKDGGDPASFVAAAGAWTILTNGDPVTPEVMFDSNGDAIAVFVPL